MIKNDLVSSQKWDEINTWICNMYFRERGRERGKEGERVRVRAHAGTEGQASGSLEGRGYLRMRVRESSALALYDS